MRPALGPVLERVKEVSRGWVMDPSVYVRQAIRNVISEGVLGSGLAALMILLFLRNRRYTAIVLTALPLAGLGSMIGLYFTHQTLNVMTLGGLALVLGMLIDESAVPLENTARHLRV